MDLSEGQEDVHSIPDVIWWNTPFDNPRSQAEARYFWNEKELGTADKGFEAVLAQIQLQKPKKIIMIGSSYPLQYSYSDRETPFGQDLEPRLRNALKKAETDLIDLVSPPVADFGAYIDQLEAQQESKHNAPGQ